MKILSANINEINQRKKMFNYLQKIENDVPTVHYKTQYYGTFHAMNNL